MFAEVSVRGRVFSVANMYAPAHRKDRLPFFEDITLSTFDPLQCAFVVGDWNCCPDPSVDRTSQLSKPDGWLALAPCLSLYFDGALAGAAEHYFTFQHSSTRQPYEARLDHVFVSSQLASSSFATTILQTPNSDHKAVCLTVTPPSFERPLLWHLNTFLLYRSDLRTSTERGFFWTRLC
jgi:endonuclease/exonuclease/phosphatase family metal-dependent hydrolase